jgi:hypothetical protein
MKNIQFKYILGTLSIAVIAILGYTTIINTDRAEEGVKLADTVMVSSEVTKSDSGKVLEQDTKSGTGWEQSPFGSGKPMTEEPKPKFQKPNTEWKSRTINGITYRFGEGNPADATPLSEEEKDAYKKCYYNTVVSSMDCPAVHQTGIRDGYVTPDTEQALLELIDHPSWERVLTSCEQQFRKHEYPDWVMSYSQVMFEGALNLENMITIDSETGRKTLAYGTFPLIRSWFNNAITERNREIMSPEDVFKVNNCITQNGGLELYRLMELTYQKQFYPSWDYPDRMTDISKYIPWY